MQQLEPPRNSRGLVVVRKPDQKPLFVDRLYLWLSTSRKIDGLWISSSENKPQPGLSRVEDALRLIKDHDLLHYFRVIRNLDRIWINLILSARAHYDSSLNACIIDERFVLVETLTLEELASTIVHEATHARLERWGISYKDEKERPRIEAICMRRELNFLSKLPHSEPFQEQTAGKVEWYANDHDYFSDDSFRRRYDQGSVETLRYVGAPDWLINFLIRAIRRRRARASALKNTSRT